MRAVYPYADGAKKLCESIRALNTRPAISMERANAHLRELGVTVIDEAAPATRAQSEKGE